MKINRNKGQKRKVLMASLGSSTREKKQYQTVDFSEFYILKKTPHLKIPLENIKPKSNQLIYDM